MSESAGPYRYVAVQQHTNQVEFFHTLDEVLGYIMGDISSGTKCVAKIIEPALVDRNDDRTFPPKEATAGVPFPGTPYPGGGILPGGTYAVSHGGAGGGGGSMAASVSRDNQRITNALMVISEIGNRPINSEMASVLNRIRKALTE